MNKLNSAIHRFALLHPRFGIPNLMRWVAIIHVAVFLLFTFTGKNYALLSFLTFDLAHLLQGEVWRLVTFALMPTTFQPLSLLIMVFFYYVVGNALERAWGTARLTLYYLSGMVLSLLAIVLASLISGQHSLTLSGAYYVHLSLFLAFALLFPDAQIYLLFLPLKAKWLAIADLVYFALVAGSALLLRDIPGVLLPLASVLNVAIFFWPELCNLIGITSRTDRKAYQQRSTQTIQFRSAARQQRQKEEQRGYRHRCEICGRTDADHPQLEFRYCSRCEGYHCYCTDHIFDHIHH